jgi:4a-hydroxytetrahydrobiopterin dehydratase
MTSKLAARKCVPCAGGVAPLQGGALEGFLKELDPEWRLVDEHHLERDFKFKDFHEALHFTNRVGALAEEQGHHPDIFLTWGRVSLKMWTHKIDGLTESDFIFAARVDEAFAPGVPRQPP